MNLKQLEYFLVVAEAGSINRAAESLRIAQSAVSRQISLLEYDLETRLFDRYSRGVHLTETGEILRNRVSSVLGQLADIQQEVTSGATELAGQVCIAIPPSLREILTVPVVQRFHTDHPKVYLKITEGTTLRCHEQVTRGEADLGLITTSEPSTGLQCTPLFSDILMLVGPSDCGLRPNKFVGLELIGELPLIVTARHNSLQKIVESELHKIAVEPKAKIEVTTGDLMIRFVQCGFGYTILPKTGIRAALEAETICAAPIKGLEISWLIAEPRDRSLPAAARYMVEYLQQEAAAYAEGITTSHG